MKKLALASLFTIMALSAASALADPSTVEVSFTCPTGTGTDFHTLRNFGGRIAGYGSETIAGTPTINFPYFNAYITSGANIPGKLASGDYTNDGTDYDSSTSSVSCSYASGAGFDAFSVNYKLTNGFGGIVTAQTPNTITISAYMGEKA